MKRISCVLVAVLMAGRLCAGPDAIAVADLQVSSANPRYQFVGKGLAELISFELSKSPGVVLIEREKRTQLLEEMEFSLSDAADPDRQLEVGRLLAARYVVVGDLVDMDTVMLASLRLIDVQTGQIVWRDKADEPLSRYNYLAGYFARSLLTYLGAAVDSSTERVVSEKPSGDAEAAVAISEAIASYDRGDASAAKQSLQRARRLDPASGVVQSYLEKLSPTAAKYKVQLELFGPSSNPAVLGVIRQDRMYTLASMPTVMNASETKLVGSDALGDYLAGEQHIAARVGVELPLGDRVGVAVECAFGSFDNKVVAPFTFDLMDTLGTNEFKDLERNIGGTVGVGVLLFDFLSVGAAAHLYSNALYGYSLASEQYVYESAMRFAVDAGLLVRTPGTSLVFDVHAVYAAQQEYFLDRGTTSARRDALPLVLEGTLTGALLDRRLFLVAKCLGDIYYGERQGLVLRAIPVVEFWPWRFLSVRAGYQFTGLAIDGSSDTGHGFVAGATVRLGTWDIDANVTSRYQPARVLPGFGKQETFVLLGVSKSDTFSRLSR